MSERFAQIDLSKIPPPDAVESLDYETILAAMLRDLIRRYPEFSALVESDPAIKVLEAAAYRELILRQRINDAVRSVMLATATGRDLDNLAALVSVKRAVIDPGAPEADPPIPPIYEGDDALRRRAASALEGYPTAGPRGAYEFHALSASGLVKDAAVSSPAPGLVRVAALSHEGDGTPSAGTLADIEAALNDEKIRPLTDTVEVVAGTVDQYDVTAVIYVEGGPDLESVQLDATSAVTRYVRAQHALGAYVATSGIAAALHRPGVRRVWIESPAIDLNPGPEGAAYARTVSVSAERA